MRVMSNIIKLSDRELDIMQVLWEAGKPLKASDILAKLETKNKKSNMSITVVQYHLKGLLEKKAVAVTDQAKVAKTTARYYGPLISAEQYAVSHFHKYFPKKDAASISGLVLAFLDNDSDEAATLDELEKLLTERKKRLQRRDDQE